MTLYLLDTNIVSDLVERPHGKIGTKLTSLPPGSVCTSIIVAAELRFGAAKRKSGLLSERISLALDSLDVVPFEAPADEVYARSRASLERRGTPIGANDLLIAAHALALGCVLVTANEREFRRVEGLEVENWLT